MRLNVAVILQVFARAGRGHAVINPVKPDGDADHHRNNGQGIQEGRKKGSSKAKRQRQYRFRRNAEQQASEDKQQQLFHKVDPGHHKYQQQEHFQI